MAKIFVDVNCLIDISENRHNPAIDVLDAHHTFISTLAVHILCYLTKRRIPDQALNQLLSSFLVVNFNNDILNKSLMGPTFDFEDNVQLHSAAEAEADYFLTSDKALLKMKFFGKAKIISEMESKI